MSSLAFVTHPSVRIKGSESVYNPVQCLNDLCSVKTPHLHCPFCVKTESYTDPVILKAHYRVKHVDKGIDFAGLKILRCCDHCDIVGVIKGEKKFKGAHWHCYRCRNGFNRRDEAIKHYKTHFRNPLTTFQISITQDLNSPVNYSQDNSTRSSLPTGANSQTSQTGINSDIIHPALTEAVTCISAPITASEQDIVTSSSVSLSNGKVTEGEVHVSIAAAGESVEVGGEEEQAIVIIQEEQLEATDIDSTFPTHIVRSESVSEKTQRKSSLEERVRKLEHEKAILKNEILELHKHIAIIEDNLKASKRREEELASRLANTSDAGLADLLKRLEADHRTLLRQQLDTLQTAVMAQRPQTSTVLQLTDHNGQEIQVVNASALEAFLADNMAAGGTTATVEQTTLPAGTIIQASELPLDSVSAANTTVVTTSEVPASATDSELDTKYVMCVKAEKCDVAEDRPDPASEKGSASSIDATSSALSEEPPEKRRKEN